VLAALLALALVAPATATAHDRDVFPPQSHPLGLSYSQWAAAWWTWSLTQPTPVNPLLDTTGAHCAQGQFGPVRFLAGTVVNGTPITSTCTVPRDKPVLFPVINGFYAAFLNDPPDQRTEAFVRSVVSNVAGAQNLQASLDGQSLGNVSRFYEESVLFPV